MINCFPMDNLSHLHDVNALDAAIEESRTRPVLLFKHSRHCGISMEALDELLAHVERADASTVYRVITVQSHRHVSDTAAERLGVRHETPQAIILHNGRPVWKASHFGITADAIQRQLEQLSAIS
jgi:bacillithiol system protein YtxJ